MYNSPMANKKDKNIEEFYIVRDKESYSKYFANSELSEFRKLLNERKYGAKEIGISYRILNHWGDKSLLPEGVKSEGWKEFSNVELVWLWTMVSLREFGISLSKVRKVKESILIWDSKTDTYPLLEYHIYQAWMSPDDQYLVVLKDGKANIGSTLDIEKTKFWHGQMDMILISLKSALKKIGLQVTLGRLILPPEMKEQELLDIIKSSRSSIDFKKLTGYGGEKIKLLESLFQNESITSEIRIKPRDGEIEEIETIETYPINPPLAKINKGIRDRSEHAEVSIKSVDGVEQSARVITRKSFKKR
jgi:DNA-binding transcriptional MerR regulator